MKKFIVIVPLVSLLFFGAGLVQARSTNSDKDFKLPSDAVEVAPNVFSLGTAYDAQSHSMVEGYAFVHKKNNAKSNIIKGPKTPACYGFLARGVKWKNVEAWTVFPGAGLDENFILNNTASNIAKWETAAGDIDILGSGSLGVDFPSDPNVLDDKNEVSFSHISDSNTIAVTIVWGVFSGPTFNRQLVAWDQIFNTDYSWSEDATGSTNQMDFENISTHELGHTVGMDDMYNSSCSTATMYGYANYGETNKRSLEQADITGISTLY